MKIGELATLTNTKIETIRFYERENLLAEPGRSEGNFRIYDVTHSERLSFIRHCRRLDMTLDEIRTLLCFKDSPPEDCSVINDLVDEHIRHVTTRIKELKSLQKQLLDLRNSCAGVGAVGECGVLSGLSRASLAEPVIQSPAEHHVHGTHKVSGRRRSK
jgi:Cd(II)/Pb(II)-responsive transcriptional regulator